MKVGNAKWMRHYVMGGANEVRKASCYAESAAHGVDLVWRGSAPTEATDASQRMILLAAWLASR